MSSVASLAALTARVFGNDIQCHAELSNSNSLLGVEGTGELLEVDADGQPHFRTRGCVMPRRWSHATTWITKSLPLDLVQNPFVGPAKDDGALIGVFTPLQQLSLRPARTHPSSWVEDLLTLGVAKVLMTVAPVNLAIQYKSTLSTRLNPRMACFFMY